MFNVVELFSGIGSQAKAFEKVSKERKLKFKVLNTCEWDIHAIVAYDYIHNNSQLLPEICDKSKDELLEILSNLPLSQDGKKPIAYSSLKKYDEKTLKRIYSSIKKTNNLISVEKVKGEDIPDETDFLTYSFPCQDLSNAGALHGYFKGIDRNAKTRSGLLWEVERILQEKKEKNLKLPKFLLLENVTNLEASQHKQNFEEWKNKLNELGYYNKVNRLYAPDFGIPQNRKRLLMLSIYVGDDIEKKKKVEKYFEKHDLNDSKYVETLKIKKNPLKKFLKIDYSNEKFLNEALECQPNDTPSRRVIWDKNSKIFDENKIAKEIVQTITTKQDRHPNSGNLKVDFNNDKSKYRFLTPRECFLLMGFEEKDFENLIHNNFETRNNSLFFSRDRLYKLAGNSIVVNVLESIFNQVIDLNEELYNVSSN